MTNYKTSVDKNQELTDLSSISKRDKVWDDHRSTASTVDSIYQQAEEKWMQKYSKRINECSPWLKFHAVEDGIKLNHAYFCKVRNCPVCQWRRSLRWKARIYQALPEIKEQYPSARWLFLTLTVKNCYITELKDNLKYINASWDKMIRRKIINKNLLGYIKSVEVTKGKNNTAHPHLHVLLLVKSTYFKGSNYLSQADYTAQWKSALGVDYEPIVHITAVKNKKGSGSMDGVIAETLKYSVKESDMTDSPYWFLEYTRQTFKTRAVSAGGVLREIIKEVSDKEMVNTELEDKEELKIEGGFNFYWFENSQKYRGKKMS